MFTDEDFKFMAHAIDLAREAGSSGEIPVGAVITLEGEEISFGKNTNRGNNNPTRHAEIIAIEKACAVLSNERLNGCTLYVTKEPCAMCAGALIHSRIERVVIAAEDEKYGACGTVFDILGNCKFNHVPKVEFGLLRDEAKTVITNFFKDLRQKNK